jgi:8-amino-7-oxononanoate synthase
VLDFTSALYLGLRHPYRSVRPWTRLTTGVPAALASPPGARRLARRFAALTGCEGATLAPSTLHIFCDLFRLWAPHAASIYMDAYIYPVARWGMERAAMRGIPVETFPHHDPDRLHRQMKQSAREGRSPVVVTDGFCATCGACAPIPEYLRAVRSFGGYLVVDDTQALGVLGRSPRPAWPYGSGGGGSLAWHGGAGSDVLVIASLAKGFGVPLAALAGSRFMIRLFERQSVTRVTNSPPSIAVIHAGERALAVNEKEGERLRQRLLQRVLHFRRQLISAGLSATGWLFPVQTLAPHSLINAAALHGRLLELGIRTVLQRAHDNVQPRISFLISALHGRSALDHAVNMLARATQDVRALPNCSRGYHEDSV